MISNRRVKSIFSKPSTSLQAQKLMNIYLEKSTEMRDQSGRQVDFPLNHHSDLAAVPASLFSTMMAKDPFFHR